MDTGDLLFGATRKRLLALLLLHPDEEFRFSDIVQRVGTGYGATHRELQNWVEAGLLRDTRRGNQRLYRANTAHPLFPDLNALIQKTSGIAEVVRRMLDPLKKSIQTAFIYGSLAKGTERAGSDVDLLVVGDVTYEQVLSRLAKAEHEIARPLNPHIYRPGEFRKKAAAGKGFVARILKEPKLAVIGELPP